MSERNVRAFVAALLRGRRPRRFPVEEHEAGELRAAITLRAARPGATAPREEFVTELRQRLTEHIAGQRSAPADIRAARASRYSRRHVVAASGIAASAAAIGVGADHLIASRTGNASPEDTSQTLVPNTGSWRTVAVSADLPEGATAGFDLGTVIGFVTRTGGVLAAVSGVCTHLGCRLALNAATHQLDCPCHNASFALGGQLLRHQLAQAPRPLPHLEVREASGQVQVFVPPGPAS